jgi:hypothetical protein
MRTFAIIALVVLLPISWARADKFDLPSVQLGKDLKVGVPPGILAVGAVIELSVGDPDHGQRGVVTVGRREEIKSVKATVSGPFVIESTRTDTKSGYVVVRANGAGKGKVKIRVDTDSRKGQELSAKVEAVAPDRLELRCTAGHHDLLAWIRDPQARAQAKLGLNCPATAAVSPWLLPMGTTVACHHLLFAGTKELLSTGFRGFEVANLNQLPYGTLAAGFEPAARGAARYQSTLDRAQAIDFEFFDLNEIEALRIDPLTVPAGTHIKVHPRLLVRGRDTCGPVLVNAFSNEWAASLDSSTHCLIGGDLKHGTPRDGVFEVYASKAGTCRITITLPKAGLTGTGVITIIAPTAKTP